MKSTVQWFKQKHTDADVHTVKAHVALATNQTPAFPRMILRSCGKRSILVWFHVCLCIDATKTLLF